MDQLHCVHVAAVHTALDTDSYGCKLHSKFSDVPSGYEMLNIAAFPV